MTTYTLSLRNNATGENVVSFTVSEQMYRYGDLGRVLNDAVAGIQRAKTQADSWNDFLDGKISVEKLGSILEGSTKPLSPDLEAVVRAAVTAMYPRPSAGFSEAFPSSGEVVRRLKHPKAQ